MNERDTESQYPEGLLDWAGHRAGGVRKLFYEASGRPSETVIMTSLLQRLEEWSSSIAEDDGHSPRILLLVGGPGNGKTEAVEFAIRCLDETLLAGGQLIDSLRVQFLPADGSPPPRLAAVDISSLTSGRYSSLQVVQDASAGDSKNRPSCAPAQLLVEELERLLNSSSKLLHLVCVNRGVLDDALMIATDTQSGLVQRLLAQVVRSVGTGPEPIACWPLEDHQAIAVWPMDIESLLKPRPEADFATTPAAQLLESSTAEDRWPVLGECAAGENCPFCLSRDALASEPGRTSLLRILRWYELASGKRWSFRDLASLYSFLLAGAPPEGTDQGKYSPCNWAAKQLALRDGGNSRAKTLAPYLLVSRIFRHGLFGLWPRMEAREFKRLLKELDMQGDETLQGFQHFLNDPRRSAIPPTLRAQLDEICEILDPALADPDSMVELSANTTIAYREIDTRFSQSIEEGLQYIRKYWCLSVIELDLLRNLDGADKRLAKAALIRNRPDSAERIQAIIRDFACRLVRRSVGCRAASVRDGATLLAFEKVVAGDEQLLYEAGVRVEELLNKGQRFSVVLNTTFGEPIPAPERKVILTTDRQRVRVPTEITVARPDSALRFLTVGPTARRQFIPLTFELYRSVRELRLGMLEASLPKAVVALLDITRARLGGRIVREEDALELGIIQIGLRKDTIVRQRGKFLVKREMGS
jgi:hypothetical protein